jgi:hypothetical protein
MKQVDQHCESKFNSSVPGYDPSEQKSLFTDRLRGKVQPRRKQLTELCLGENDGNMTPVCEPCKSLYFSSVCLTTFCRGWKTK